MRSSTYLAALAIGSAMLAGVASAQELPNGPGKEQLLKSCTACHAINQVTDQRKSKAEWADTVDQMIARGAQVEDPDYQVIVAYLAKNLGPAAAGSAPAASGAAPGAKR
jgi:mono/diheme cytochrome c family protein